MSNPTQPGTTAIAPAVDADAVRWTPAGGAAARCSLATEVPFTIVANEVEVATLLATPRDLCELTYGYLYTSGFIKAASQVARWRCDTRQWRAEVTLDRRPDPALLGRRLYTAGCGLCAMYASVNEIGLRRPMTATTSVEAPVVAEAGRWIAGCSAVFRETGGVHAAGLYGVESGPVHFFEDVARHNAVDKAIGRALMEERDLGRLLLARTGRTSAEIVFKARRADIAITIGRGAPTHQAVLLAKDMGMTLVGFAREDGFTVYTHSERIRM